MTIRIVLTELERRFAVGIGNERIKCNEGVPDPFQGPASRNYQHIKGALGEFAFCKAMNIYPPIDAVKAGVRPPFDCILGHMTVDVKTVNPKCKTFKVAPSKKDKPCDLYCPVVMFSENEFVIHGYVIEDVVFSREPQYVDPGDKEKRYIVGMDEARDIEELMV